MSKSYLMDISPLESPCLFSKGLFLVEETRKKKVLDAKCQADKNRVLGAGILLSYALKQNLPQVKEWQDTFLPITYGEKGKPYFRDYPNLFFSLSHSGDYVLCTLSEEEVGADIQQFRPGKEREIAEKYFTPKEKQWMFQAGEEKETERFFRLWVVKEAYMKLTGKGLSLAIRSFEVEMDQGRILPQKESLREAVFQELKVPEGYAAAKCSYKDFYV